VSDAERLLAAIHAAPDDDAPRLVYADWLQSRGDPRGELIALQCALGGGDDERFLDARWQRASWLLRTFRQAWLPASPTEEPERIWYDFRRGFPDKLSIETRRFAAIDLEAMRRDAPLLRRIRLSRVPGIHPQPSGMLARFAELHDVPELELWDWDDLAPADLRDLPPSLTSLVLVRCRLDPEHARALAGVAPALRVLSIVEGKVGRGPEPVPLRDDGYDALSSIAWPALTHLSMVPYRSRAGVERFVATVGPGLRHLRLSAPELPRTIAACDQIGSMSLSLPALDAQRAPARALKSLWLKLDRWDDTTLPALARWLAPGARLGVGSTPAGDDLATWAAGADLAEIPAIEHCRIGDVGARAIAASPLLAKTALLELGYNRITDDGGEVVASAPLEAVRGLSIGGNVGDRTLRALARNASARHLRVVFLNGTAMTAAAAIEMLDALPQLEVVVLPHSVATQPDVAARLPSWRPPE
jgi:uncharacterized protein (TIGR02996 family)